MADYVAILGLSTFGQSVAIGLEEAGMKVLAIDKDEIRVDAIKNLVTHVICGDLKDQDMLIEVGVTDCQTAVLCIPDHFDVSVLVVYYLSKHGLRDIIVQVNTDDEAAAIERVGASRVIFPERVAGLHLVRSLSLPGLLERVDLSEDAALAEIPIPSQYVGKSLKKLDLRKKFDVTIVGLISPSQEAGGKKVTHIPPDPDEPLGLGMVLMVLAKVNRLRNFTFQLDKFRDNPHAE
jgi:trk system potassium uptake protein TrkA